MSVLEFTTTIRHIPWEVPTLPAPFKRRSWIMIGMGVLAALLLLYMYFAGSVVTANIERSRVIQELKTAVAASQSIEQMALTKESMFTAGFFMSAGYEEPRDLGIIKRTHHVAEQPNITIVN